MLLAQLLLFCKIRALIMHTRHTKTTGENIIHLPSLCFLDSLPGSNSVQMFQQSNTFKKWMERYGFKCNSLTVNENPLNINRGVLIELASGNGWNTNARSVWYLQMCPSSIPRRDEIGCQSNFKTCVTISARAHVVVFTDHVEMHFGNANLCVYMFHDLLVFHVWVLFLVVSPPVLPPNRNRKWIGK